jgi:hypothetical protein
MISSILFFLITLAVLATLITFLIRLNQTGFRTAKNQYLPNGYHQHFKRWSEMYRKHTGYTCEQCGIRLAGYDKFYLHTHHIDGNKANNHPKNFKALCIACHAEQPGAGHERLKQSPAYHAFVTGVRPAIRIKTPVYPVRTNTIYQEY